MTRTTIDYGIDLGTTNSAIAVLKNVSADVIKNNADQDVTPSAVYYDKNGQVFVGTRAKNAIIDKPKDAYAEFKRRMGIEYAYAFKGSGLNKKPEELSAEVLKALRADVARVTGEEIHAAVITVPAAFELHQCDATRRAAELAGLKNSPLLQEPVAAALAYGFQVDSEKAYWLVYDFGGGTFDAALIKADEGMISVVHHGGDNFLGGSDIDWAILEKIVAPRLAERHRLPDFKRGSTRWERELLKLKRSVELAKIELTTKESTTLMDCRFDDADGDEVDAEEITLTRAEVVQTAEPLIRRSVEICQNVLREKKLNLRDVQKVILVGGPTKAPYFREILKDNLGIPIDHSVDPLTVVAKGAAIFAGTEKLDARLMKAAQVGEFQIDLKYKPVGHEADPLVGGKVSSPGGVSVSGFAIELVNEKSRWRSGRIPLRDDGAFMANLLAEKGERNTFAIELYDATGTRQKTVPDHLVYTIGAVIEGQPLIHSMGVALAGNEWEKFFEKGAELPLRKKGKDSFRTTNPLTPGAFGAAITIPIIEGENEAADRNRLIGSYQLTSEMIRRDLPAGSEIEIELKMDKSRIITLKVYVPSLDEEFEHQFDLSKKTALHATVSGDLEREQQRMRDLKGKASAADDERLVDELDKLRGSPLMVEIKDAVSAAAGDPDAAEKAELRLLELKIKLDEIETKLKWPALVAEVNEWLDDTKKMLAQTGNAEHKNQYEDLREETDEIIRQRQTERLDKKFKQVQGLYFQILFAQPSFWVNQFRRLEGERGKMSNRGKADELFERGRQYLSQNNVDGLRNVVGQLWDLLPRDVAEQVKRGYGSNIVR